MNTLNLSTYSPEELIAALRVLKSYTVASKQIGRRAVLQDPKHLDAPTLRVEFAPGSDESFVRTFSTDILARYFPESQHDRISFVENKNITGGIRIFLGDDMVDISFERFSHVIKNA